MERVKEIEIDDGKRDVDGWMDGWMDGWIDRSSASLILSPTCAQELSYCGLLLDAQVGPFRYRSRAWVLKMMC